MLWWYCSSKIHCSGRVSPWSHWCRAVAKAPPSQMPRAQSCHCWISSLIFTPQQQSPSGLQRPDSPGGLTEPWQPKYSDCFTCAKSQTDPSCPREQWDHPSSWGAAGTLFLQHIWGGWWLLKSCLCQERGVASKAFPFSKAWRGQNNPNSGLGLCRQTWYWQGSRSWVCVFWWGNKRLMHQL